MGLGAAGPSIQHWLGCCGAFCLLLPPPARMDWRLALGTRRSLSYLPNPQHPAPSRINLLISADSFAFSSTSVSISFMRLPISSEMRAAVSRSTLGTHGPSAPQPHCPHVRNKACQGKDRTSCV